MKYCIHTGATPRSNAKWHTPGNNPNTGCIFRIGGGAHHFQNDPDPVAHVTVKAGSAYDGDAQVLTFEATPEEWEQVAKEILRAVEGARKSQAHMVEELARRKGQQ